jgi:hypothetical protein
MHGSEVLVASVSVARRGISIADFGLWIADLDLPLQDLTKRMSHFPTPRHRIQKPSSLQWKCPRLAKSAQRGYLLSHPALQTEACVTGTNLALRALLKRTILMPDEGALPQF